MKRFIHLPSFPWLKLGEILTGNIGFVFTIFETNMATTKKHKHNSFIVLIVKNLFDKKFLFNDAPSW